MLLRRRCSRVPHVLVSPAKGPSGRADLARRVAITSQVGSHRGGSGTGSKPLLALTAGQPHILDFAYPLRPRVGVARTADVSRAGARPRPPETGAAPRRAERGR